MLNSILETRNVEDGLYNIKLTINENEYFSVYESISEEDAAELLDNYLKYRADDGRPKDVKLKHDKDDHMIYITADLHYIGNEKTLDMYNTHDYISNDSI